MLAGYLWPPNAAGRGNVYVAQAIVTAMAAYTATAAVGGPLLWNGSNLNSQKGVTAYLLSVSYGLTTASTAAAAIGITGNSGQPAAPTSTTAIDGVDNLNYASTSPSPGCTAYKIGTVVNAGAALLTLGQIGTSALTTEFAGDNFVNLGGMIVVPPGCWAGVAASATMSSAVMTVSMVWLEMPND